MSGPNPFAGLRSVGPATHSDLARLGIHSMAALAAAGRNTPPEPA